MLITNSGFICHRYSLDLYLESNNYLTKCFGHIVETNALIDTQPVREEKCQERSHIR